MSGNSLCLWALNRRARKTIFAIGNDLGIFTKNSTELMEQLRGVDFEKLQESSSKISVLVRFVLIVLKD